jgi:CysZ protein
VPSVSLIPALPARSQVTDFFRGVKIPVVAAALIPRSRALLRWSLLSSAVTLVGLVGSVAIWLRYTRPLLERFVQRPENAVWAAGWWLLWLAAFAMLTVVSLNTVPVLLLAPLQDPISEATEALCGDSPERPFSGRRVARETATAFGHTVARIAILVAGHGALLALHLIPVVGSIAWTILSTAWTMVWLATEYLDAPMARHLYRFGDVRAVVLRRFPLSMGFGAALYVLLWVPLLNLFLVPVAVIAGTLLFRGLRTCGALAPPSR